MVIGAPVFTAGRQGIHVVAIVYWKECPHLCLGWHAICLSEKNVGYFCLGCSVCHLHAMLHRGFCCKLFALGDVQTNADTFDDAPLLPSLTFQPHKASVSQLPSHKKGDFWSCRKIWMCLMEPISLHVVGEELCAFWDIWHVVNILQHCQVSSSGGFSSLRLLRFYLNDKIFRIHVIQLLNLVNE